jgi:hypothetical protein
MELLPRVADAPGGARPEQRAPGAAPPRGSADGAAAPRGGEAAAGAAAAAGGRGRSAGGASAEAVEEMSLRDLLALAEEGEDDGGTEVVEESEGGGQRGGSEEEEEDEEEDRDEEKEAPQTPAAVRGRGCGRAGGGSRRRARERPGLAAVLRAPLSQTRGAPHHMPHPCRPRPQAAPSPSGGASGSAPAGGSAAAASPTVARKKRGRPKRKVVTDGVLCLVGGTVGARHRNPGPGRGGLATRGARRGPARPDARAP